MESKARLFWHSVHQMLIVFPLGLLATAVVFDIVYLATDNAMMAAVAYWMVAAGIIGALVAAPFGTIDWLAIPPDTRAKKIGAIHGGGNLIVALLFIGSWVLRGDADNAPPTVAYVLSFAGAALALFTGWLGWEMVYRKRVAIAEEGQSRDVDMHHSMPWSGKA